MHSSVSVNGVTVPFTLTGSGPHELVLVHGTGPGGAIAFDQVLEGLGATFRIAMPDLSGSPTVEDGGVELSVEMLARQVLAVADGAGFARPVILGFSLGGPVALAAAALAPERVRALVISAGWLSATRDEYLRVLFDTWTALSEDPRAFGMFSTLTGFSPEHLAALPREHIDALIQNLAPTDDLRRQLRLGASLDVTGLAGRVAAPTLVLANAHDATIPPHATRAVAEALRGSQLRTLPSGHVVTMEQSGRFVTEVVRFVEGLERP